MATSVVGNPAAAPSAGGFLAGFLLSGFLLALLGAILPAWGGHLTSDLVTIGNYFLALAIGLIGAWPIVRVALRKRGVSFLLVFGCSLACAALLYLSMVSPPLAPWWRYGGLIALGMSAGLLNAGLFHGVAPLYHHDPAATLNLGGVFWGIGCLAAALLVAGTFYAYSVGWILRLVAVAPGYFVWRYARSRIPAGAVTSEPSLRESVRDFRSPAALLFALLLFFQFGNEWSVAGWLALYLTRQLGLSPETSLLLLGLYWASLLLGRLIAVSALPLVRHARLLMGSALAAVLGCILLLSTNNAFGAVTAILLLGGGYATIYPLVAEKIGRRFPYYRPGLFNGIFSFAMAGALLAPWTFGFFADMWGIAAIMAAALAGSCLVFTLLLLIWAEARFIGS